MREIIILYTHVVFLEKYCGVLALSIGLKEVDNKTLMNSSKSKYMDED